MSLLLELQKGGEAFIVPHDALPSNAALVAPAFIGAPTASVDKLPSGLETVNAVEAYRKLVPGVQGLLSGEIGGSNSIQPLLCSTKTGTPPSCF